MSSIPNHGTTEMIPVFSPQTLGVAEDVTFLQALERLSGQGDLKATLLKVALTHFAARGYDGVQVREVAEEAGVSKPTLYYHFGSKEGLFRQLCLVAQAVIEHRIHGIVQSVMDAGWKDDVTMEEAAFRVTKGYVHLLLETPEFTGFVLRSIAVPSPDSGFRDLMPLVERAISPIGAFIHRAFGVSFEQARKEMMIYHGIASALIEERLRRPEYEITDEELRWALSRWLRGIRG
jgi:AcrR family transcriptional regulator